MTALMLYHDRYDSTGPLGSAAPDVVLLWLGPAHNRLGSGGAVFA